MASNFVTKTTSKDKEFIYCEQYKYYLKRENKDTSKIYVCKEKDCSASISILNQEIIKINGTKINSFSIELIENSHKEHDKVPEEEIVKEDFVKNLKSRIADVNAPLQQLYQEEQTKIVKEKADLNTVACSVPQFYSIKSSLYRYKSKFIPTIPETLEDIKLEGDWTLCEDKKRKFLLHHTPDMIVFCSESGLEILFNSRRWQADGTFSCVPLLFSQLYIIHGYYESTMIPCAFVLLTGNFAINFITCKYLLL